MKIKTFLLLVTLICASCLNAFPQQARAAVVKPVLNHSGLLQKLAGLWVCNLGQNRTAVWEVKTFGTGIEATFRIYTGEDLSIDGKQLWGYDEDADLVIGAGLFENTGVQLVSLKFSSATEYVIHFLKDAGNPDAPFKVIGKLEQEDTLVETTYEGNKVLKVDTWKRVAL